MFLTFVMEPHFERNCRISGKDQSEKFKTTRSLVYEERSNKFIDHESSFIDNAFSTLLIASFLMEPPHYDLNSRIPSSSQFLTSFRYMEYSSRSCWYFCA